MEDDTTYEKSLENASGTEEEQYASTPSVHDLLERSAALLAEVATFKAYAASKKQEIELSNFRGNIESERKPLTRSLDEDDPARKFHLLRSSNLPFYEAVWATAKRSQGVIAFSKRFYYGIETSSAAARPSKEANGGMNNVNGRTIPEQPSRAPAKSKSSALVDVVCQDGAEWIRVSTITQRRLLFDLAKQGWELGHSSDEDDEDRPEPDSDPEAEIAIVRMATELVKAANATRIRYKHPRIRLMLPKIVVGEVAEIDSLLDRIRSMGVTIETSVGSDEQIAVPSLDEAKHTMLVDQFSGMTETLNIDCTILLALVSDISHSNVSEQSWFHKATRRQIEVERAEPLLPTSLYPAIRGHKMVCTRDAAQRMREIVNVIATDTEKARTDMLFDESLSEAELRMKMQLLSDHPVPDDWRLPIQVEDYKGIEGSTEIPSKKIASLIAKELRDINESVFFYGWEKMYTTVTSNRTVVKQIEGLIERHRGDEEVVGPPVWLSNVFRSLLAKDKDR